MPIVNSYLPGVIAIPSSLNITAISQSFPMIVTVQVNSVTESFSYIVGQLVRLIIPYSYGMNQANNLTGQIVSVSGLNIGLNIDSTLFDPFVVPAATAEAPASLAPAGSRNLQYSNNTNEIAFQNLNNIGN